MLLEAEQVQAMLIGSYPRRVQWVVLRPMVLAVLDLRY